MLMLNYITKKTKLLKKKKKKKSWEPGIQANGATKATSQGSGTSEYATLTYYLHSPHFTSVHKWHGVWRGSTEHGEHCVWDTADRAQWGVTVTIGSNTECLREENR